MADIFISFKTEDTPRVQAVHDGFLKRGLTVFWSNDIPKGAANYQANIRDEILKALVVVVIWTHDSVHSGPVVQECSQAEKANKLFQILLDDIEPIDMPMEVKYKSQKTMLLGWTGDTLHAEWTKINHAIDARLGRRPGAPPLAAAPRAASSEDRKRADGRILVDAAIAQNPNGKWFEPGAGKIEWFKDHQHGPEMVVVPGGNFTMGSAENEPWRSRAESPQQKVTIAQPFAAGRHSITRGQFAAFVNNTGYKTEGGATVRKGDKWEHDPKGSWRNPGFAQDDSHPVVCVNWDDANAYATWLSDQTGKTYRLLTEAEREYVARAGTTTPFWWGSLIAPTQANYNGNYTYAGGGSKREYRMVTVPVGSFAPNPWGLFNVHGNVREWCEDVWHDNYNGAPTNGFAWLQGGDAARRIVRGGSWLNKPRFLRAADRNRNTSGLRSNVIGFRLARMLNL